MTVVAPPSILTRKAAVAHTQAVRDELKAALGEEWVEGWCELASWMLAARLTDVRDAEVVFGSCGYGHHWWVRVADLRLDCTVEQFEGMVSLPVVCKDRHKRSWYTQLAVFDVSEAPKRLADMAGDWERHLAQWRPLTRRCGVHAAHGPGARRTQAVAQLTRAAAAAAA